MPTITEIRMIDTYWSDHCRHTTFGTDPSSTCSLTTRSWRAAFERYLEMRRELGREEKPVTLMDMGTIGRQVPQAHRPAQEPRRVRGDQRLPPSRFTVDVNGEDQDWLFLFKNETHNHPTEIEPFGGAATCIGGAIRDPLSGRSYVLPGHARHRCGRPPRSPCPRPWRASSRSASS